MTDQSTQSEKPKKCETCELRKKLKSMRSTLVIAAGLVVGLLFVDVAQLFTERGLSARALDEATVVTYDGSTWVKYKEPHVRAYYFSGKDCSTSCETTKSLLEQLRFHIPTMTVEDVSLDTEEGRAFAASLNIEKVPTVILDSNLANTRLFLTEKSFFQKTTGDFYELILSDTIETEES